MTTRVLYLHGLGSTGQSSNVQKLRAELEKLFDHVELVAPDYLPESATAWRNFIDIADQFDVVIGTSMGGYHALKMAQHDISAHYIVVNPCYDPLEQMRKYVGKELPNFRDPNAMRDTFTDQDRRRFTELKFSPAHQPITWVIGENDQVIDSDQQHAFAVESVGCEVIRTNWGHRIEDQAYMAELVHEAMNRFAE